MKRFYFICRYLPAHADNSLLAGRCIQELHKIFSSVGGNIAVSFPDWTDETIGSSIAFVSNEEAVLHKLKSREYFSDMLRVGAFSVTDVFPVPDALPEVRFIRNQRVAKLYQGEKRRRLKRAKRRALGRGEDLKPERLSQGFEVAPFHRALISSAVNQKQFILHIQKEVAEAPHTPAFCSYGLATTTERNGTVPDLRGL